MKRFITCSVGLCVYNEEKNIAHLLRSLLTQKLRKVKIEEIIVIASGSTDKTNEIIKIFIHGNKKIKLLQQKRREGKASAVNIFIDIASQEILVLLGGDLILSDDLIEQLVSKFANAEVGMTGARPVPINDKDEGLTGFAAYFLWELHHRISLQAPKMGEVVAFRKIFKRIPGISSVDEANIEPLIRGQGYKILYVPQAQVRNKAPTTIGDFIKQRRRIYGGHLAVKYEQSYEVTTLKLSTLLKAYFSFLYDNRDPKYLLFSFLVIILEVYSRLLGWWDYTIAKKRHTRWEQIRSTKDLLKKPPPIRRG